MENGLYTENATTTTQKQSDYMVEQSSLTLIALFDSKFIVVVIGFMETRLNSGDLLLYIKSAEMVLNLRTGGLYYSFNVALDCSMFH